MTTESQIYLGRQVLGARIARGWSVAELSRQTAEHTEDGGTISRATIAQIESGELGQSRKLLAVGEALGLRLLFAPQPG